MKKNFEYKTQYQKENYKRIYIDVPKELGETFDKLLKENNTNRSSILKPVIENYIKEHTK